MKLRVGDTVLVTAGKDKGKSGKVERVLAKDNKIIVAGVNIYKRHLKPNAKGQSQGGIIDLIKPLPMGNVALVCPKCNLPSRIGYKIIDSNKKERICRKCKEVIEYVNA
ncbi:MAG: 50S ribosomal protein L24 [Patescibacteria group bacterium]|nr:50S ribosomal protein L24 [Patescibacteria group bacterium]